MRNARTATWIGLAALLLAAPAIADTLQYGDGEADGKKSFGGGGHLIVFDAGAEGRWLNRVELFGSRYGTAIPPDEDFHLYVVDANREIVRKVALPYLLWERGEEYWRELPIPPIQVPEEFGIGLTFNAERSKGVYLGSDNVGQSHSFSWVPGTDGKPMEEFDWMVRVTVEDDADGDPEGRDLVLLKDGTAFFDRFLGVAGDPLMVNLAGWGALPMDEFASIRLGAISSAGATDAVIVLLNGMRIECQILAINDDSVRIQDASGTERELPRSDLARIDFK